jgi:hypothetical protein
MSEHLATSEMDEIFNAVEQQSNLGKQILRDMKKQEPYGHVTVRRLSRRHENHADQYHFYPSGQIPYLDNVDECHAVYTHPPVKESLTTEQEPVAWHHPDCEGECIACLIERTVLTEFGNQGLSFLQKHLINQTFDDAYIAMKYDQGIQEGMKRERALWLMQAEGQKIEQPRPLSEDKKLELISQIKGIRGRVFGDSQLLDLIDAVEAAHGIGKQS